MIAIAVAVERVRRTCSYRARRVGITGLCAVRRGIVVVITVTCIAETVTIGDAHVIAGNVRPVRANAHRRETEVLS
jgi:hypothetical protein